MFKNTQRVLRGSISQNDLLKSYVRSYHVSAEKRTMTPQTLRVKKAEAFGGSDYDHPPYLSSSPAVLPTPPFTLFQPHCPQQPPTSGSSYYPDPLPGALFSSDTHSPKSLTIFTNVTFSMSFIKTTIFNMTTCPPHTPYPGSSLF